VTFTIVCCGSNRLFVTTSEKVWHGAC